MSTLSAQLLDRLTSGMADSIDWTDETLRPLDELARLAFPDGGVTAKTLKLRARQGKLAVYRPGKAYLASLSGVRVMIGKTRVETTQERPPPPLVPNSLGLTEMDLSNLALDAAYRDRQDYRTRLGTDRRLTHPPAKQSQQGQRRTSEKRRLFTVIFSSQPGR
jgi:hypothetical protein